jgi:hypothetical protein
MSDVLHATDVRPDFQLWLFPHLVLAALPPVFACAVAKRFRPSTVDFGAAVVLIAILAYGTSDGWVVVTGSGDYAGLLRWWVERCTVTGVCTLLVSAVVTGLVCCRRRLQP